MLADERAKLEFLREQALRRALAVCGLKRETAAPVAPANNPKLTRTFAGNADAKTINKLFEESGVPELIEQHKKNNELEFCVDYWTCGKFDAEEIAERAVWETGSGDREYVGRYLRLLNRAGLVKPVETAK